MLNKVSAQNLVHIFNNVEKNLSGAPFTIKSNKTGKDYTFKVKQSMYNGYPFMHVYVEQGYLKFKHLGFFSNRGTIIKKGVNVESPSALAIAWVLRNAKSKNFKALSEGIELFHMGNCMKCGKPLTDAHSIEIGFGPICANHQ